MELTLRSLGEKAVKSESTENFADMLPVLLRIIGVDEDIVQVDDNRLIEQVLEDVVHETLESSRCVSKTFGDNQPFKRAITSPESCFPLVSLRNPDQMVRMAEIDLRVNPSFTGTVEEVGNERKWVVVFLGDAIESPEIHTEAQRSILLLDEEDRSSMRRCGLADKSSGEVLVDELAERVEFSRRKGVKTSRG